MFRDVTTLMQDSSGFALCLDLMAEYCRELSIDKVVGTEARGFIFAAPLAYMLGVGFVPVRKPNKLPGESISQSYELEYGSDQLEIHIDAIEPGERVLIVDDLLATGGTVLATAELVRQLGGIVEHASFIVSLPDLGGENRLVDSSIKCFSLCQFDGD